MAITQSTALTQLRDRLGERGSGSETTGVWTNPQLRRYLNEAQRELARRSESIRKTTTTSVTANTQTYSVPTDMIRITDVQFYTSSTGPRYNLEYRDRAQLHYLWGTSEVTARGYPEFWTIDAYPGGTGLIVLFPTPSANGTIKIFYYAYPADLATNTSDAASNLTVPAGWEDVLLDYAEYRALRQNRQTAEADMAYSRYTENLMSLAEAAVNYTDKPGEFIYAPYYDTGEW